MTKPKWKVAIAGLCHDHVWTEAPLWQELGTCELVAASDKNEKLCKRAVEDFDVPSTFADWQDMLSATSPDILLVFSDNKQSAEIALAALKQNIHVMIEKPLAASYSQAQALYEATQANPAVKLLINWPDWCLPHFQMAPLLIKQGAIGTVVGGSSVMGHPGPLRISISTAFADWLSDPERNGGGALIDYGCYGAAALTLLVGEVTEVFARKQNTAHPTLAVEDNAQIIMQHGQSLTHIKASWTMTPAFRRFTINGTEGTIVLERAGGWIQTADSERLPIELPEDAQLPFYNAAQLLTRCIKNDEPIPGIFAPEVALQAQRVVELAYKSANS